MKTHPYNETFKFQPLAGRDVDLHPDNRRFAWSSEQAAHSQLTEEPPVVWPARQPDPSAEELSKPDQGIERTPDEARPQIRQSADGRVEKPQPAAEEPEAFDQDDVDDDNDEQDERAPRVLMVDSAGALAEGIADAASGMTPEPDVLLLGDPAGMVEAVEDNEPDVLIVAPADLTQETMGRLADVRKTHPKLVTVLSDNDIPWTPAQMVASGARDILPAEPSAEILRSSLDTALRTVKDLKGQRMLVTERIVVQKIHSAPVAAEPVHAPEGHVFTVSSATGGSGKTFLSSNLAAYLVKATGKRVLLIDLDMQFGSLTSSLHLHPKRTIDHLVKEDGELDAVLSEHLVEHKCGCKVLCAPADPLAGESTSPQDVTRILAAARKQFDYIVVDSPPTLSETCLAAFDQSEALLVIANMDVPSLKNMRRFLETLDALKVPRNAHHLVINRADAGMGIEMSQVEPLFPQGFMVVLPSSDLVRSSINMGVPLMYERPDTEMSRLLADGFMKLVPAGAGMTPPPNSKSSRFKGLRRSKN